MSLKVTGAMVSTMLAFMLAQEGKHYSEALNLRLGPNDYDCSGLVYTALHKVGVAIPQSDSTANTEANWLGSNGATVVKDESQVKTGDIVFFHGAAPGASNYGPIGHVGMATDSSHIISAYDTASGILVTPMSQDQFVVAMRLSGDTIAPGSATPAPAGGGGLLSFPPQIMSFFSDAGGFIDKLMWLANPASWVRIVAFLGGVLLLLFAIHALVAAGKGEPLVSMPSVIPVPV
jgi:hypothetical protein